jgi:hypothetical protein
MKGGFFVTLGMVGALAVAYVGHQVLAWGWNSLSGRLCPVPKHPSLG